jgi:MFS family permease
MATGSKMDRSVTASGNTEGLPGSIWSKNFALLCLSNLALLVSVQLLLPTLPLYLQTIGGSRRDVGIVMSAYTISAMFMRAVAGWLSDRWGRRNVMIVGLAMILAVTVFYRFADSVPLVATIRALHGLAFGLAGTAMGAIAADSLPLARMAEGIGYFGLTVPLSMGIAPMIGIFLAGKYGYSGLFTVVSSMALATLLCGFPVKSVRIDRTSQSRSRGASPLSGFVERAALLPSLIMFFLSLVNGAVAYFIALYAHSLNIGNVGLFFASNSLFMIMSRPLSGRWADRGGTGPVVGIGFLALFAGTIVIGFSHQIVGFLVAGALMGMGSGFSIPTLQALAVRHVPADRRGAATGTYFAAFDMGFGVGALVWGFVAELTSYRTMYLATLLPLALAAAIYYKFEGKMVSGRTFA